MRHGISTVVLVILIAAVFLTVLHNVNAGAINVSVEVTLPECSNGIDDDGDFLTDYPDDTGCSSSIDNNENTDGTEVHSTSTIASSGGSHSFDNNDGLATDFTFPDGFHTESVRLFANSYASGFFDATKPAPTNKSAVGKTYDFILYEESSENKMATTSESITIVLRYNESDVSGINEAVVAPYRWGDNDSSWQEITGSTLDTSNNKVTFSTSDFSSFALFGTNISAFACSDSIDNDGDGKIDFPDDPGCSSTTDNDETDPVIPSGGGGGGGGSLSSVATVVLQGRAYPQSAVTILADGKIQNTVIADKNAVWTKKLFVASGPHIFGVYSADSKGRRSLTYTFSLRASGGTISTVSGIFIAPTLDIDKSQVRKGDVLNILGQTAPSSTVSIFINSEDQIVHEVLVDEQGAYFLAFDTDPLSYGDHTTKSQSLLDGTLSAISQTISFKVGTRSIVKKAPGDISGDGRVNIIDLSILLFWWGNTSERGLSAADINKDARVDLKDLSIMLFYWTP